MNLETCRAEVYSYMNDPDKRFLTLGEVDDWLHLAQLETNAKMKLMWNNATLSTDGTAVIDLDSNLSDFMAPLHVFYDEEEIKFITPEELIHRNARWATKTGTPERYYLKGKNLGLYPYLTSAESDIITLQYLEMPNYMTSLNDSPFNGISRFQPLHSLVVIEACMKAATKMKDTEKFKMLNALYERKHSDLAWLIEDPNQGTGLHVSTEGAQYY